MKQDIKLYIDDKLVDFSSELSMPFVYQLEDTNNPTVVKNFFTKTITIVGTKNNNKIFGDIYNFDRTQLYNEEYLTGVYFNPSYRTPFQLFRNGELFESGYMQLNSITIKNKVINYEITLYGGLGDFFYNIMYNKYNEKLKLSDLIYGVEDDYGVPLDPEKEMDFYINAHFVKKCWDNIGQDNKRLTNFITFAPSYNGLYNNFDNNKVLINTNNSTVLPSTTTKTVDGKTYRPYNGYALAEINGDMTEWEIRDLRSYMQRPALRLKRLIEAICDPINNGGYEVELDSDFFTSSNDYWEKSYIGLPLFSTSLESEDDEENRIDEELTMTGDFWAGDYDGTTRSSDDAYLVPKVNGAFVANGDFVSAELVPVQAVIDGYYDFQLLFTTTSTSRPDTLYDTYIFYPPVAGANWQTMATATYVQLIAYDEDDFVIGYSNAYCFSNQKSDDWVSSPSLIAPITDVTGNYQYSGKDGIYSFVSDEGHNTFRLTIDNVKRKPIFKFKLVMYRCHSNKYGYTIDGGLVASTTHKGSTAPPTFYKGKFSPVLVQSMIGASYTSSGVYSNNLITKEKLLKTENTPADYLLSYCKMFGLYFSKDNSQKKIYIRQRNNFFTGDIINWSDRIDYSKDIKINPIVFDKKFYRLALKDKDSYLESKYKNEYGVDYGQKRINTAYNFNSETTDLLKDNVFENTVPALSTSQYYRLFYSNANVEQPPFLVNAINYRLYNTTTGEINSTDITLPSTVNLAKTVNFNAKSGYDIFPKQVFFKRDNDKESLNDINSCLLLYTGNVTTSTDSGEVVKYWLTDDVAEMNILNSGKACHLYTESTTDVDGEFVAYAITSLPKLLTYDISLNKVTTSFDFGVPKEIYIPDVSYEDTATIYNKYWANFYADQLSVNTKKVTAYVNLEGVNVNSDLLRNFYFFNNSVWILNKVNNYNPNAYGTTQCEFIKVQNTYNYTKKLGV